MKTAQVEKEIEWASHPRASEMRNLAAHEFDPYAGSGGPAARDAERALDRVDPGRFPTLLRQVNRGAAHTAAEIKYSTWAKCLGPFEQLTQAP